VKVKASEYFYKFYKPRRRSMGELISENPILQARAAALRGARWTATTELCCTTHVTAQVLIYFVFSFLFFPFTFHNSIYYVLPFLFFSKFSLLPSNMFEVFLTTFI
jgi:hypothetical protein